MFFRKNKNKKKTFTLFRRLLPRFTLSSEASRGILLVLSFTAAAVIGFSFFGKAGDAGVMIDQYLGLFFGQAKWSVPALLILVAFFQAFREEKSFDGSNVFGLFLFFISFTGLLYLWEVKAGGGYLGALAAPYMVAGIGELSTGFILIAGTAVSLQLLFDTSLNSIIGTQSIFFKIIWIFLVLIARPFIKADQIYQKEEKGIKGNGEMKEKGAEIAVVKEYHIENADNNADDIIVKKEECRAVEADIDEAENKLSFWKRKNIAINYPSSLLHNSTKRPTSGNISRNQAIIKQTLSDFGIPITLGEVRVGPTVTQYTFKPSNGIPVARVKALADDLALNLALHPVRIEAPIPGKSFVGLEVPNQSKVLVTLKEVLQSSAFKNRKSNMMLALGRDVTGQIWLDDLAGMPHILVAGATGSGKSICLHSFLISLLFQNNPDDLKLILIDVKQVELSAYNNLPYLIAPVITEDKRAIRALHWCLGEMERRLEIISQAGCQNIQDYNRKKRFNRMPYLVLVVDELGDLLTTARKDAENAIIRLGQKARASGIHLILATQRPTVDILSGLIKANLPGRVAFQVTSSLNSKTILDYTGAEKLLGHGDMLFINPRLSKPVRIQGAYISKEEITAVAGYAKQKAGNAEYIDEITDLNQRQAEFTDEVGDQMLEDAKRLIFESGKASTSMLQSRLGIGYPRANRILDILEKQGIVGPSVHNRPREVFGPRGN